MNLLNFRETHMSSELFACGRAFIAFIVNIVTLIHCMNILDMVCFYYALILIHVHVYSVYTHQKWGGVLRFSHLEGLVYVCVYMYACLCVGFSDS